VVFRDLRLNHPYTTSLCITNSLDVSVDFALRPSHSRYQVSPNSVQLRPGQSIVVSIRIYLSNYPKVEKGLKGPDYLLLVSSFFQQKIEILLIPRSSKDSKNESIASELRANSDNHNSTIGNRNSLIHSLGNDHPDFEKILEERIELERLLFEEKSQKVPGSKLYGLDNR
jgi:hypothetical protein